jgi:SAM-dependent methyltransferase
MSDVEYRGMVAETWDLLRGDTSGWSDRRFYLEAIDRFGKPVLDVGCGTGRLLLDYAARGIDIDGVDVSAEMLALCREKAEARGLAPAVYEQRMESLDLPRTYRTIIVPSSSFQLLLEPADAVAALAGSFGHLEIRGALVLPFMVLWRSGSPLEHGWTREAVRPGDGAVIRRHSTSRFDPTTALEHTTDTFEVVVDGVVTSTERHVRSPATRSYDQDSAVRLLREAGFDPIELHGEFTWLPPDRDGDVFCVVAIKP